MSAIYVRPCLVPTAPGTWRATIFIYKNIDWFIIVLIEHGGFRPTLYVETTAAKECFSFDGELEAYNRVTRTYSYTEI